MDSKQDRRVVLLPIKPEYAQKILSGEKKIEFRKKKFASEVKYVIIYASHPVKLIIGFFSVDGIEEASPTTLWRRYCKVGGISYLEFRKYFHAKNRAVGIRVSAVSSLSKPVSLRRIGVRSGAPQSFAYVSDTVFRKLEAMS